jgi:hypothetical protein
MPQMIITVRQSQGEASVCAFLNSLCIPTCSILPSSQVPIQPLAPHFTNIQHHFPILPNTLRVYQTLCEKPCSDRQRIFLKATTHPRFPKQPSLRKHALIRRPSNRSTTLSNAALPPSRASPHPRHRAGTRFWRVARHQASTISLSPAIRCRLRG